MQRGLSGCEQGIRPERSGHGRGNTAGQTAVAVERRLSRGVPAPALYVGRCTPLTCLFGRGACVLLCAGSTGRAGRGGLPGGRGCVPNRHKGVW